MRNFRNLCVLAVISAVMILAWTPTQAQFGGIKNKLKKEAEKKASEAVDSATASLRSQVLRGFVRHT